MLCLYVYVISFSTSVRSNQALSLFVDQFAGCLNQGMVGTDSMSWLFNLGKSWPFFNILSSRPIKNFWILGKGSKKIQSLCFDLPEPNTRHFLKYFRNNLIFCQLKVFSKISENESSQGVSTIYFNQTPINKADLNDDLQESWFW